MNGKRLATWAIGFVLAFAALPNHAKTEAPFTLEEFFKLPEMGDITISPNGKYMAATMPFKGRMNLGVIDLETRKAAALSAYTEFDVQGIRWIGNDRLMYTLGQTNTPTGPGRFDGGGLFVIDRDGKNFRVLSKTVKETRARNDYVFRGLDFARRIPGTDDEIIASGNMTSAESEDLYRLNIRNGRYTLITRDRPADYTSGWIMDDQLVPRVVTAWVRDTLTNVVYYRKGEGSPWTEIARYERNKGPILVPLAINAKDNTLQVAYNGDPSRDTMGVYKFDPETKKIGALIASHPRFDMGANAAGDRVSGVVIDSETDKLLGYRVQADKPLTTWLDEKYAKTQAALDRTFPGKINSFSRLSGGSNRLIVTSYSDVSPTRWYFYDEAASTLEPIGSTRPWLDGKLTEQRSFFFKTRDGLEIPGYYFLPRGYKPGTKLPTIVHIHGGPHVRADTYANGFGYREGQLFAAHGYAVIVPNFRITPGLGSKIYYSGFGSFGRQMSDDHEDALKWGIEQGFVDPDRVCMSGASYGGYAPLQALARNTNDMWKCAVAGLAVTDLEYQLTSRDGDTAGSTAGVDLWKSILGTKDLSSDLVKSISPLHHASKMKKPVFLYAGLEDIRVPIKQISLMAKELERVGNPPKEYMIMKEEGHGIGKAETNVELYTKIL
ncbi:MAG: S9 family peptidase, partial [Betaproteobacteria bacterium]|nr:S9 family peptidase [Betaproteobacteria bacterium]